MRTRNMLFAAALALAAAACQRESTPAGQATTPTDTHEQAAEGAPVGQLRPVGDGVSFAFSYMVNKDHIVAGKDDTRNREILLEYSEGGLKQVDERVRLAFKARGYARPTPATRNGAIHSTYRKEGQPDAIDPEQLVWIVQKNDPKMKTVILKWGAMFTYPDDQDMGTYRYPDWRERYQPERSREYGSGSRK